MHSGTVLFYIMLFDLKNLCARLGLYRVEAKFLHNLCQDILTHYKNVFCVFFVDIYYLSLHFYKFAKNLVFTEICQQKIKEQQLLAFGKMYQALQA